MERSVFEGVALGVSKVLSSDAGLTDPAQMADVISKAVMEDLSMIIEFDLQEVKPTNSLTEALNEIGKHLE